MGRGSRASTADDVTLCHQQIPARAVRRQAKQDERAAGKTNLVRRPQRMENIDLGGPLGKATVALGPGCQRSRPGGRSEHAELRTVDAEAGGVRDDGESFATVGRHALRQGRCRLRARRHQFTHITPAEAGKDRGASAPPRRRRCSGPRRYVASKTKFVLARFPRRDDLEAQSLGPADEPDSSRLGSSPIDQRNDEPFVSRAHREPRPHHHVGLLADHDDVPGLSRSPGSAWRTATPGCPVASTTTSIGHSSTTSKIISSNAVTRRPGRHEPAPRYCRSARDTPRCPHRSMREPAVCTSTSIATRTLIHGTRRACAGSLHPKLPLPIEQISTLFRPRPKIY